MAKIVYKGTKEDGLIDAEIKRTPVLITELIEDLPKLCQMEIVHRLEEIRSSSERDRRVERAFIHALKVENERATDCATSKPEDDEAGYYWSEK